MKIKLCRVSGRPVDLSTLEAYKDEFGRLFDTAERICKKDMLRLQKKVAKFESLLQRKYPIVTEIGYLLYEEEWQDAIKKYGNIMVATQPETGKLIYVIMDQEDMRYS